MPGRLLDEGRANTAIITKMAQATYAKRMSAIVLPVHPKTSQLRVLQMSLEMIAVIVIFHGLNWLLQGYYLLAGVDVKHRGEVGEHVVVQTGVEEVLPDGDILI